MKSSGDHPGKPQGCNYFVTTKPGQNKTARAAASPLPTAWSGNLTVTARRGRRSHEGAFSISDVPRHPSLSLEALVLRAERAGKGAPPVDRWNPPFCGDLDMAIRADGSWTYNGTAIARPALVRLFSTVLRKDEDGRTYLVTPAEKLGIRVEDAHFLAVEMSRDVVDGEPVLTFRTDAGDVVAAGPDHPLRFAGGGEAAGFKPYLAVRGRLEARLTRALAFDLADVLEPDDHGRAVVRSNGARFEVPAPLLGDGRD